MKRTSILGSSLGESPPIRYVILTNSGEKRGVKAPILCVIPWTYEFLHTIITQESIF